MNICKFINQLFKYLVNNNRLKEDNTRFYNNIEIFDLFF